MDWIFDNRVVLINIAYLDRRGLFHRRTQAA